MKQTYLLIVFSLITNFAFSQNVVFTDHNFKQLFIKPWWDTNNDGEISLTEAINITSVLEITNVGITDLTGIEYMPNITSLIIRNNPLSAPVNLTFNTELTNINLQGGSITIPSINITGLTKLKYITLNGSFNALDVSNKPELESLMIANSSYTPNTGVQYLDVTNSPLLKTLSSSNTNLTSIDITQNPLLEELDLPMNNLTTINISQNPLLKNFNISVNPLLGSINVSTNPLLERLAVSDTGITTINLQNNPLLKYLAIQSNDFSNGIDISNLTLLEDFKGSLCNLTHLDTTNNLNLTNFQISNNNIPSINVSHLTQLRDFDINNNHAITSIDLSQNPDLVYVWFTNCSSLEYINLKNGNNSILEIHPTYYGWLSNLLEVCVDDPNSVNGNKIQNSVASSVNVTSNCTLSTNEFSKDDNFSLYPNPVDTDLYIKTDNELKSYQIYNQSGQLVDKGTFKENNNIVPMKTFSAGTYFITIITDKGIKQAKIIKK